MNPFSTPRRAAFARGEDRYHATPCKRCGSTERYTKSGNCVSCKRSYADRVRAAQQTPQPTVIAQYAIGRYEDSEVSPCDACSQQSVCRAQRLACADFVTYQSSGRLVEFDRAPTATIYASLFTEEVA